ncbi:hypothetical protein MSAN_01564200 [Mycena sanguinolenta]|uniref:Uncharacterized protein n=1 Tax=Mycena sanguinolenta TaxID=230812 RepID=A0A8H7CX21_9AGAR|nr:hypothetical protein MSAN_01564200 [Mycena sanguinolenta]
MIQVVTERGLDEIAVQEKCLSLFRVGEPLLVIYLHRVRVDSDVPPRLHGDILIFRVFVVYPPRTMSWPRRLIVFGPLIVFKIIRVANLTVFLVKWIKLVAEIRNPVVAGEAAWSDLPWTKIEWFFRVFDNWYASVLFLLRVHQGRVMNARSSVSASLNKNSYASRLRSLFFIALGNFVFPSVPSLIQLIFLFHHTKFLDAIYVFLNNCYVEIIGVLLATIWVAGGQWSEDHGSISLGGTQISAIRYQREIHIAHPPVTDSSVDQSMAGAEKGVEMSLFKADPRKHNSEDEQIPGHPKDYTSGV